jgi:hypothetical protein
MISQIVFHSLCNRNDVGEKSRRITPNYDVD